MPVYRSLQDPRTFPRSSATAPEPTPTPSDKQPAAPVDLELGERLFAAVWGTTPTEADQDLFRELLCGFLLDGSPDLADALADQASPKGRATAELLHEVLAWCEVGNAGGFVVVEPARLPELVEARQARWARWRERAEKGGEAR